jgi:YfiH family protein
MFSTRAGGVSGPPYASLNLGGAVGDKPDAVEANRSRLAAAAGLTAERVVWMRQVHGTMIQQVREHAQSLPDCDGIVTATADLGLAVLVADCVPILLADPDAGVIGAVHAGRRGAAGGIALRALDAMTAAGASIQNIDVMLGPAICGRCYEVPPELCDDVEAELAGSASSTDAGTAGLDLRAGLARQLRGAGVAKVEIDPRCTYTDPRLFSHRRGTPTGRFAGLIWLSN